MLNSETRENSNPVLEGERLEKLCMEGVAMLRRCRGWGKLTEEDLRDTARDYAEELAGRRKQHIIDVFKMARRRGVVELVEVLRCDRELSSVSVEFDPEQELEARAQRALRDRIRAESGKDGAQQSPGFRATIARIRRPHPVYCHCEPDEHGIYPTPVMVGIRAFTQKAADGSDYWVLGLIERGIPIPDGELNSEIDYYWICGKHEEEGAAACDFIWPAERIGEAPLAPRKSHLAQSPESAAIAAQRGEQAAQLARQEEFADVFANEPLGSDPDTGIVPVAAPLEAPDEVAVEGEVVEDGAAVHISSEMEVEMLDGESEAEMLLRLARARARSS